MLLNATIKGLTQIHTTLMQQKIKELLQKNHRLQTLIYNLKRYYNAILCYDQTIILNPYDNDAINYKEQTSNKIQEIKESQLVSQ